MPSRYLFVVKVGKDVRSPEEVYVVAAYGRKEAVELALGKYANVIWVREQRSQSWFKVGNSEGEVLVCWSWKEGRMVRKTDIKNGYIQLRDGYVFLDETELKDYLDTYKYIPKLRDWIVFIDRFGRSENVKSWEF